MRTLRPEPLFTFRNMPCACSQVGCVCVLPSASGSDLGARLHFREGVSHFVHVHLAGIVGVESVEEPVKLVIRRFQAHGPHPCAPLLLRDGAITCVRNRYA